MLNIRYTTYFNRPDITPEVLDKMIAESWAGEIYRDIARRYKVSINFVAYVNQQYVKNVLTRKVPTNGGQL